MSISALPLVAQRKNRMSPLSNASDPHLPGSGVIWSNITVFPKSILGYSWRGVSGVLIAPPEGWIIRLKQRVKENAGFRTIPKRK
jgi:hypothetical protein